MDSVEENNLLRIALEQAKQDHYAMGVADTIARMVDGEYDDLLRVEPKERV